jgi:hypothetical protein
MAVRNMADRKIAKHKKYGWSYEKQLREIKETEKKYHRKDMDLSPVQEKRKKILIDRVNETE